MVEFKQLKTSQGKEIKGPLLIKPRIFEDERGFFYESWNKTDFEKIPIDFSKKFVQDNHSRSSIGVLRGLHYQLNPAVQGKLVRCSLGEIFDVAVDLRSCSETFGEWVGIKLTASNKLQLWIPEGFAHGFLTISDFADVQYKATDFWNPKLERSIKWNDPELSINWPENTIRKGNLKLNSKDKMAPSFEEARLKGDVFV